MAGLVVLLVVSWASAQEVRVKYDFSSGELSRQKLQLFV
jgi:hypothetical protein